MSRVTVEKYRDALLVTVHHADGDQLACPLDRAAAIALRDSIDRALVRTVQHANGRVYAAKGRKPTLTAWNGETLTTAEWAARAGITVHCMQARIRQHGVVEAMRRTFGKEQ